MLRRSILRSIPPVVVFAALLLALAVPAGRTSANGGWWNAAWHYRVPVTVPAGSYARVDRPVEVSLNFTSLLAALGQSGAFDDRSIRVVEVNGVGAVTDPAVPFQFERASDYNAATKARGTLVFIMKGTTAAGASRTYHVYFGKPGVAFAPPSVTPLVAVEDLADWQGQAALKITTARATYYYHKVGAGLASIIDAGGADWISYRPCTSGGGCFADGEYRGIPNTGDFFHPGYTGSKGSTTTVVSQGPVKLTLSSVSTDNKWETRWEFYPGYATMTMVRVDTAKTYWVLYEGTPGGRVDTDDSQGKADRLVRSSGQVTVANVGWTMDSGPGDQWLEEWAYVRDGTTLRQLFFVHHEDDAVVDSYKYETNSGRMTILSFGRNAPQGINTRYLTAAPQRFTIGLTDPASFEATRDLVNSAYRPLAAPAVGAPEAGGGMSTAPVAQPESYGTLRDRPLVVAAPGVLANDSDPNGGALSAVKAGDPSHGTLALNANGSFTYTPAAGYVGGDSFSYRASDGAEQSEVTTVTITVVNPAQLGKKIHLPGVRR